MKKSFCVFRGFVGIAATVFSLYGCGGDPSDGTIDVGSTGGPGGASGETVGSQCEYLMRAICGRAFKECTQSPSDYEHCVSTEAAACCADACGAAAMSTQERIERCHADADAMTCDSFSQSPEASLPATCRKVVLRPAALDVRRTPALSAAAAALGDQIAQPGIE